MNNQMLAAQERLMELDNDIYKLDEYILTCDDKKAIKGLETLLKLLNEARDAVYSKAAVSV